MDGADIKLSMAEASQGSRESSVSVVLYGFVQVMPRFADAARERLEGCSGGFLTCKQPGGLVVGPPSAGAND